MQSKGFFVTFEGGEGCGKSTQVRYFERKLKALGVPVISTKEPGGTQVGAKIREILFSEKEVFPGTITEVLLFFADRAQNVAEVIKPFNESGAVILCDRYLDSTLAYQWGGRGIKREFLLRLHCFAAGNIFPDLTFYIDLEPKVGLGRKGRDRNRFDDLDISFHRKVRHGYKELVKLYPERIVEVDGRLSKDALSSVMWQIFQEQWAKFKSK